MRLMLFIWLLGAAGLASPAGAQGPTPKADWPVLNNLAAAGWNPGALAAGRSLADSLGTAAYMLIEDGRVVDSYGDISRAFRTHSMRKSFLSALYGVHLPALEPYLDRPLAELPIDDYLELTAEESMATLRQLLLSRSGIYRSAAYENPAFDRFRPEPGSHPAGTFWFYSNWDFNVAGAAFEILTERSLFAAFRDGIAAPLGMEDFDLAAMEWRYDRRSWHPAYLFRMSTRDLARFGLLYLRGGEWDGREIVPRSWVEQTTAWSSDVARPDGTLLPGTGYGTMWWVLRPPAVPESFGGEIFAAEGTGTQAILVLPALNIVFVHRTDTDLPSDRFRAVSSQEIYNLLDRLLVGYPEQRTSSP